MSEIANNFIHDIIDADLAERPDTKIHTRFPPENCGQEIRNRTPRKSRPFSSIFHPSWLFASLCCQLNTSSWPKWEFVQTDIWEPGRLWTAPMEMIKGPELPV